VTLSAQLKKWRGVDDARDGRGDFTQEEAAARLGVPSATYKDWEQGRKNPRGLALEMVLQKIGTKGAGRRVVPSNRKTTRTPPASGASKKRVTHAKAKTRKKKT
jgi:hypothetical protein